MGQIEEGKENKKLSAVVTFLRNRLGFRKSALVYGIHKRDQGSGIHPVFGEVSVQRKNDLEIFR